MHKIDKMLIATVLVTVFPVVFYLIFWRQLPAKIPTHFNANFQANGYTDKSYAIAIAPVLFLAFHLYTYFQKYKSDAKLVWAWLFPVLSVLVQVGILLYVLLR